MSRSASTFGWPLLAAGLLALPAVAHLPALLAGTYSFYDSYLTGQAAPAAAIRLADALWIGLCLGAALLAHHRMDGSIRGWGPPVLLAAAFVLVPPFGSHDAVYYFRMAERWIGDGANPYLGFSVLNPFLGGGVAAAVDFLPYPPLWVLLAGGLYRLAGGGLMPFCLLLKAVLGAAHVGNFLLLRKLAEGRATGEAAAWAYLCHPLFLLEGLSLMHFDLLWLLGCLGAAWQLRRGRWWAAAAAWAAAFGLKYTAVFALPLFLPVVLDSATSIPRRLGRIAGALGLTVATVILAGLPFGNWGAIARGVARQAQWPVNSLAVALGCVVPGAAGPGGWGRLVLGVAALAVLAVVRPRPDPRTPEGAAAWTVLILLAYLLLASPVFWPWYSLWPLLFSSLTAGTRWEWLRRVAGVFAACAFLLYPLTYLVGPLRAAHDLVFQSLYALLACAPALALLAAGLRRQYRAAVPS